MRSDSVRIAIQNFKVLSQEVVLGNVQRTIAKEEEVEKARLLI